MTYKLLISRKTTINSYSPGAYTIHLTETGDGANDRLTSSGTVDNDTNRMSGVFRTEREAVIAALGYVTANVAVVADTDWLSGVVTVRLVRRNSPPPHGVTRRILGANSRAGIYVSI